MRRAKAMVITFIVVIIGFIALFLIFNTVRYPLSGSFYGILKVNKDDITTVKINHRGNIVTINDHETIQKICNLFDVNLRRGRSDYFSHSTGAVDWTISFVTSNKEVVFGFSPFTINVTHAQIFLEDYWYSCDEKITVDIIKTIWNKNVE